MSTSSVRIKFKVRFITLIIYWLVQNNSTIYALLVIHGIQRHL